MAQVKISKAQQMVLDDAKKDIDFARAYETFEEWKREYYEADKAGCPLVTANTRTLRKLEEMGLIEVVKEGGSYPDRIKVIGY